MADTKLFLILVTVLALGTITTGVILLSYNSWAETGTDFYQADCPPGSYYCQAVQPTNITEGLNFTSQCNSNASYLITNDRVWISSLFTNVPSWRCRNNVGWITEESGQFGLYHENSFLLFTNLQAVNGVYNNTY